MSKQILLLLILPLLAGIIPGCGEKQPPIVAYAPPPPDTADAYWRQQYKRRRITPPQHFSVAPVPPRNNNFGEFDDSLYNSLDQQPQLPPLPGDIYPMAAPGAAGMAMPNSAAAGAAAPKPAAPAQPPARTLTPSPTDLAGPGLGGIDTGQHYYPVEQLVYGGDFPDLDQPEKYRFMPKDEITVTVKDHPEFSGPVVIQPDGTVRLPNTPDLVRLRGLNADEAAEAICGALAPYIKGECLVRVQANRASGGYYYVFGDVLQPGRFPMGIEPVKLSEAILAANWEVNPAQRDVNGDDLSPSFPAAVPRGKYVSPGSADLARVMLVTPHRSQPARSIHDVRSALMGMTGDDPLVRAGQIIIVPSLNPEQNRDWGLQVPEGLLPGQGFSTASSPARLPAVEPPAVSQSSAAAAVPETPTVETNMELNYTLTSQSQQSGIRRYNAETDYPNYKDAEIEEAPAYQGRKNRIPGW